MTDNEVEFTDAEVDELVSRALAWIGELLQEVAHRSFSIQGARHISRYAEAEIATIKERVYGAKDGRPDPVMRRHTLNELRRKFPEPLPQLPTD